MAELIVAVTELFRKQSKAQDLHTKLLSDFASLQVQTQAPQESNDAISVVSSRLSVWTRNTAERVLVTQLQRGFRETKADVDAVALECIKEQGLPVPDKHKQAASFMEPLVDVLLKEIIGRVPAAAASFSADSEELIRAKAKLAQAGLALTPRKPAAPSQASESPSKPDQDPRE